MLRITLPVLLALLFSGIALGQPRPGQQIPPGLTPVLDVEYAKVGERSLKLDVFLPEKVEADAKLPLVIWVHGGGWSAGDKRGGPFFALAGRGYVLASINYRLSQAAVFPAQIQDCKGAIRFLRANAAKYHINPEKVGVWGSSAGGHLVALLGTSGDVKELEGEVGGNLDQSSRVQAVCDWFGPTDLTLMSKQALPIATMDHDSPKSPESQLIGGPIQENKEKAQKANPISYVSKDDPPMLIMHGDKDPLVPPGQSVILLEALKKAGVEATLHVVPGAGHGFGGKDLNEKVEAFFDKTLKGK